MARTDMTLYEISDTLRKAIEDGFALDEETGEFWDESDVESLSMALQEKAEGCALYRFELQNDIAACSAEIERLSGIRKKLESSLSRFDGYLLSCIERNGGNIDTPRVHLGTRRSQAVQVLDEGKVPDCYKRTKVTVSPDKAEIKRALRAGEYVPGCALVTNTNLIAR